MKAIDGILTEFLTLGIFSSFRNSFMSSETTSFVRAFPCSLIFWMSASLSNNFEKSTVIIFKKKKEIVETN